MSQAHPYRGSPGPTPLLDIAGLKTHFHSEDRVVRAVDGIDLQALPGQTLGIVGESGSGKSVTSLTVMGLLPELTARVDATRISFMGRDLLTLKNIDRRAMRGRDMAMIFQEPMTSLNPVFTVGEQVAEAIRVHEDVTPEEAEKRVIALFEEVGIPDPTIRIHSYPHEMSGGQKQRVMIAMALACSPKLLIADEPTTALDVTIQAQILDLLRRLRDSRQMSILFITHDLGVIAEIADRVLVMFRGRVVEEGDVLSIFENPQHPYTKGLLACRPRLESKFRILPTVEDYLETYEQDGVLQMRERDGVEERIAALQTASPKSKPAKESAPILKVRDLKVHFPIRGGFFQRVISHVRAVDGVSFEVARGTTMGLVGESGCGKTTTGRALLRLIEPTAGEVEFEGAALGSLGRRELREIRRKMQIIFQDPYSSLNPRMTVASAISEPMLVHGIGETDGDRLYRVAELLREVGLLPEHMGRYPHEFSGGQRQRICIARTLALEPEFIVCDESVSALDVSVQAQVLNLLRELQDARGLTYIFISHDLSVVKHMSDEIAVMRDGKIVEAGPSEQIYREAKDPYTQQLISAIPRDDLDHIRAIQRARTSAAG